MVNEWLDAALAAISGMDPTLRTLAAGAMILLETSVLVGLIVPGESVVLIASTGIEGWAEWAAMIAAVVAGALCGESIGYAIGRWLGPRAHESTLARRIGVERVAKADALLRRRGGPAIFASRFVPVLHSIVPLAAGMSGIAYRRFIAWSAPACATWALLYVSAAAAASTGYRELSRELHWAGLLIVGLVAVAGLAAWAAKRIIARRLGSDDAGEATGDEGPVEGAGREGRPGAGA